MVRESRMRWIRERERCVGWVKYQVENRGDSYI